MREGHASGQLGCNPTEGTPWRKHIALASPAAVTSLPPKLLQDAVVSITLVEASAGDAFVLGPQCALSAGAPDPDAEYSQLESRVLAALQTE